MLQGPRARQASLLGHVADQPDADLLAFGHLGQAAGHLAHLTEAARSGLEGVAPDGLDGVRDDQRRLQARDLLQHRLQGGLCGQVQAGGVRPEPTAALAHLRQGLLPRHVEDREFAAGQSARRLEHQGGFSDARIPAEQDHAARNQSPAQHPVELADSGGHPPMGVPGDVRQEHRRGGARRRPVAPPPGTGRRGGSLGQASPRPAVRTASQPARRLVAALLTLEMAAPRAHAHTR
jgi:hypothetical protein